MVGYQIDKERPTTDPGEVKDVERRVSLIFGWSVACVLVDGILNEEVEGNINKC